MMRILALWISGLIAGAMVGGMIFRYLYGDGVDFFGGVTGMAVFVCARLWVTDSRCKKKSSQI